MKYKHNSRLTPYAKRLRAEMTEEERRLWYVFLRQYPVRFLRQKVIDNYIVDFYCAKAKLVIELDGTQHYEAAMEEADRNRDAALQDKGLVILRFSNRQINREFRAVCEYIDEVVKQRMSTQ